MEGTCAVKGKLVMGMEKRQTSLVAYHHYCSPCLSQHCKKPDNDGPKLIFCMRINVNFHEILELESMR